MNNVNAHTWSLKFAKVISHLNIFLLCTLSFLFLIAY